MPSHVCVLSIPPPIHLFIIISQANTQPAHLPELVAQTNMDQQSVNRLREELNKLTNWIAVPKNFERLFAKEYETPHQSYIERASRG